MKKGIFLDRDGVIIGNKEENPGADAVFPNLLTAVPWIIDY